MDATLPQGSTHMFVCAAVADPFPFFTFRFNGERVTSNTSERILVTSSTSATLTLYNLQGRMKGPTTAQFPTDMAVLALQLYCQFKVCLG